MRRPLLVSFFLLFIVSCVNATHWAYGTIDWGSAVSPLPNPIPASLNINVNVRLGFRTSFPWGVPWPGPFNPGTFCFFECQTAAPFLCPNVASALTSVPCKNVVLPGQTQFSGDWFIGSFSFSYGIPTNRPTGMEHTNCCRLSAIRDTNHDVDWRVQAAVNAPELLRRSSLNSPRTTGLARYYFQVNVPIVFFIPGVHPDNFPLRYGLAGGGATGSGLTNPTPTIPTWGTQMTVDTVSGQVQWTPSQTGLFAMQFLVLDFQSADPKTRVPLDFIMEIIINCPGSNTNKPPYFSSPFDSRNGTPGYVPPLNRTVTFYAGLETSFQVCATDPDAGQYVATIDGNNLPTGATYNLVKAPAANQPTCYTIKWTPAIDQTSQTMCFLATDNLQCPNLGQYCILLAIGNARIIYVSGIIRDFRKNHTDFARGLSSSNPSFSEDRGLPFVGGLLNPTDRKPYLAANFPTLGIVSTRAAGLYPQRPTGLASTPGYYDWWYTDPAPQFPRNLQTVFSIVLTNAGGNPQLFTFNTSAWWPIDNQLFGNEGDAHNRYFTYEVNSYLTYIKGNVYSYRSSDDMWIFIEGYLPNATMGGTLNSPPGWPLSGVKIIPDSAQIDMDSYASALGLVVNETYRVDLFYCQRNALGTASIQIQLPDFSLCNGLTSGVVLFNFTDFAATTAGARLLKLNNAVWTASPFIPLITTSQTNINTGAWYATDGVNPLRSKILYGFETQFSFQATGSVEGFALVFHNSPFPTPNGGQGPNLGYSSISNSVAIEFDTMLQATYGDHNQSSATTPWGNWWSEVSFHTGYDQPNSASETFSLGFNGPTPPLNFANNTVHNVKIQYQTGQITNGQPSPSWFRVYMGVAGSTMNIVPIAQAQIDAVRLGQIMAGAARIGFTAGASTGSGSINILSWSLLVVPVSPQQTGAKFPPFSITAGQTGTLTMQTKDACGNNILVGGELSSFAVSYFDKFCPGAPVYTLNVTQNGTDNMDGTYTFPYNPTKASIYTLPVTFKNFSTLNSPYEFIVYAGPIYPPASRVIFGQFPARYSSLPLQGIIVGIITARGRARAGPLAFDFTNVPAQTASGYVGGPTELLNLLSNTGTVQLAVGDFVLVAMNSALSPTVAASNAGLNTKMQQLGAALWPPGTNQGYAFISEITSITPNIVGTKRGEQEALGYANTTWMGTDSSSVSFTRFFDLQAESLITACGGINGGFARINSVYRDVRVPAGSINSFTVTAVDAYGNEENTPQAGYTMKATFTPDFTVNNNSGGYIQDGLPPPAWTPAHYELGFMATVAQVYSLYVKLDGTTPVAGSQFGMAVTVTPGLAARCCSTASGGGTTTGVAGTNTTFTMLLRDANNNPINFDNPDDVISAYMTSTTGQNVSVTLAWIDDPSNNCVKCLLQGTYNVTQATIPGTRDWSLYVNINGVTGIPYGNPNIVAGPIYYPNVVTQGCAAGIIYAGNTVTCRVQTRDIYNNDRYVGNTTPEFTAAAGSVEFRPTSVTSVNVAYESAGRYLITFIPTIKGPLALLIQGGGVNVSGSPVMYQIYPGAPAPSSFFNNLNPNITVVAGAGYIFTMTSRDVYNNIRDLGVANSSDYFLRLIGSPVDGMLNLDASSTHPTTGIYTFKLNQTTPLGLYQISVKTRFGQDITNSPFQWVIIVPDVTYPPNTIISGSGASGCISGTPAWFTIAARDIWTNPQNNNLDQALYVASVQYPLTPSPVQAGAGSIATTSRVGVFNVTYTCPTIVNSNNASTLTLAHPGNATRGFGPWSVILPLLILPNAGTAFGKLTGLHTVISGEAVVPSFVIQDCTDVVCSSKGQSVCGSPCYTVTMTSVSDPTISISPVTTTWLGNGNYNVTFISPYVGQFLARLYKYGFLETEESKNATYLFNVTVGYVDALQSQISGLPAIVDAGTATSFSVQLKDKYGHLIGGGRVVTALFSSSSPGAQPRNSTCTYNGGSGMYDCGYNITTSGAWQVNILSDGFAPSGPTTSYIQPPLSPFSLTINALGPFCTFTTANPVSHSPLPDWYITAGALSDVGTSYTGEFTLVVKDKYSNPATISGSTLTGASFTIERNTLGSGLLKDFTLVYTGVDPILGGAIFSVSFAPSIIDTTDYMNDLTITIGGCGVMGSPFHTLIQPATPSGALSDIQNKAVTVAGDDMTFTLSLRDIYNNPYFSPLWPALYDPLASVQLKEARTGAQALLTNGVVNGTFDATLEGIYTTKARVAYNFTITIDGVALTLSSGNEKNFQVVAGPTWPSATAIDPTTVVNIDDTVFYSLYTFDKYGNTRNFSTGNDIITWNFVVGALVCDNNDPSIINTAANPASYQILPGSPVNSGTYKIGFIPHQAGTFTFNISVNSGFIDCVNNPKQLVLPGRAWPAQCSFTIVPPAYPTTPAGSSFAIIVDLRDKYGNPIQQDGSLVAFGNDLVQNSGGVWNSTLVQISGTFDTNPGNWMTAGGGLPAYPTKATGVDMGAASSQFSLSVTPFQARNWPFAVAVYSTYHSEWEVIRGFFANGSALPDYHIMVTAGPVASFVVSPNPINGTAALYSSLHLQATDQFGNPVQDTNHRYYIQFARKPDTLPVSSPNYVSVFYQFSPTAVPAMTPGEDDVPWMSYWHGNFTVQIALFVANGSFAVSAQSFDANILHATCNFEYSSTNYRCPDRSCVAQYSSCAGIGTICSGTTPILCNGNCQSTVSSCTCPSGTRCQTTGVCTTTALCPAAGACNPYTACPDGSCRASTADCSSAYVCVPGFSLCPDGLTCARNLTACADYTPCPGPFIVRCGTGACVNELSDCPTKKTCVSGVVCPDGSCQTGPSTCPDQYACYPEAPFRCSDGSCRSDPSYCPTEVTCPVGDVKCEDGLCAVNVTACSPAVKCDLNRVRCPDGSCQHNLLFCPTRTTCPITLPVKCPDGSCKGSSRLCYPPPVCPYFTCPDGSCVMCLDGATTCPERCPSLTACPLAQPVLCLDGNCVTNVTECSPPIDCPPNLPLRCPDGSCRADILDCPSRIVCPADSPVLCPSGLCSVALDQCASPQVCPTGEVRCPSGNCAASTLLCPSSVTCPLATIKCLDGTCRQNCTTANVAVQSCAPLVTCPQTGAGVTCSQTLNSCPSSFICPASTPVRCIDASCAAQVADCPTAPPDTSYPVSKVPCPDGTWASTSSLCATPVSCGSTAPYKCYDGTCRVSPADCPIPYGCGNGLYKCPTGACTTNPWDPQCTVANTPCSPDTPVACSDGSCTTDANKCPDPLSCTSGCALCAPGLTPCKSGVCVSSPTDCPAVTCPDSASFSCPDGSCALASNACPTPQGCPANLPTKCFNGVCVSDAKLCPSGSGLCPPSAPNVVPGTVIPVDYYTRTILCDDGSCATSLTNCPTSSGCPQNQVRCFDGTCVSDFVVCNSTTNTINTCPANAPFRCPDGFCSTSTVACPPQIVSANCTGSAPFQCANGYCVSTSTQCPLIYPCDASMERCPDGTCKPIGACPVGSTCPSGSMRCWNGLCSTTTIGCSFDPTTGCPTGYSKCPAGLCVVNTTYPGACTTLLPIPNGDGCAQGSVKCQYSGECKTSASLCPLANGCPPTANIRCITDGSCTANVANCPNTPCIVRCADGTCVSNVALCSTSNYCPITSPIRCADGFCQPQSNLCNTTVVCPSGTALCSDGSCKASLTLCPATLPCSGGTTWCAKTFKCELDCSSITVKCPVSSPVLCNDGTCTSGYDYCGYSNGGPTPAPCATSTPVRCFDGSCAVTQASCVQLKANATGIPVSSTQDVSAICGPDSILCFNGACVDVDWKCPPIPACPVNLYRCPDGVCDVDCAGRQAPQCANGLKACEDGLCRKRCLHYDGCGLKRPYHCSNRECGKDPNGCAPAATGDLDAQRRRLLSVATPTKPCLSGCYSQIKASQFNVTIQTTTAANFPIALDSNQRPVMSLNIPSGSMGLTTGSLTTVSIRLVAESTMRGVVNAVHPSRVNDKTYKYDQYLTFAQTVVSPAFECDVEEIVGEDFLVPWTVTSLVDDNRRKDPSPVWVEDICLASLRTYGQISNWLCQFPSQYDRRLVCTSDQANSGCTIGQWVVRKPTAPPPTNQVSSIIKRCTANNVFGGVRRGTAYAFITAPVPTYVPLAVKQDDVLAKNVVAIIFGIIFGIVFLGILFYLAFRLSRYRKKYKDEKAEADRLKEEVQTMERFGAQAGQTDDQVAMTENPLAAKLAHLQQAVKEEDIKLQEAEQGLRVQEADIRREHIDNMRQNRDKMFSELEKLKRQVAEAQATSGAATHLEDEPAQAGAGAAWDSGDRPAAEHAGAYGQSDDGAYRAGFDQYQAPRAAPKRKDL
jgi:fibro-slime domain-containing protein